MRTLCSHFLMKFKTMTDSRVRADGISWDNQSHHYPVGIKESSLFINCQSCTIPIPGTLLNILIRMADFNAASATTHTAKADKTLEPFDAWWCKKYGGFLGDSPPVFYGFNSSVRSLCYSIEKSAYNSHYAHATPTSEWSATITPPCCDPSTKTCAIIHGDAQVLYWPTPAPTPAITTLVSNGFTL